MHRLGSNLVIGSRVPIMATDGHDRYRAADHEQGSVDRASGVLRDAADALDQAYQASREDEPGDGGRAPPGVSAGKRRVILEGLPHQLCDLRFVLLRLDSNQ